MRKLLIFLAFLAPALQADTVAIHLSLDAAKTLPGIPVGIAVTANNSGDAPVTVPSRIWMRLDKGDGSAVLVSATESSDGPDAVPVAPGARVLAPHTTAVLARLTPPLIITGMPWLGTHWFAGAGNFVVTVILADTAPDVTDPKLLSSNAVEPDAAPFTDDDAAAWQWLGSKAPRGWTSLSWATQQWANELLARFPHSDYAPYALFYLKGPLTEKDASIQRVLSAFPRFPLADELRLEMARQHHEEFLGVRGVDPHAAMEHARMARAYAAEVIRHSSVAEQRTRANDILDHTPAGGSQVE